MRIRPVLLLLVLLAGCGDPSDQPVPSPASPDLAKAKRAEEIAAGRTQSTREDLERLDIAPLGPDGTPQPDGVIDTADVVMLLRRAITR